MAGLDRQLLVTIEPRPGNQLTAEPIVRQIRPRGRPRTVNTTTASTSIVATMPTIEEEEEFIAIQEDQPIAQIEPLDSDDEEEMFVNDSISPSFSPVCTKIS